MPRFARQGGGAMLSNFLSRATTAEPNVAASEFLGTWRVEDSHGHQFEIALFGDGTAEANRAGEGMTGTWTESEDGVSAVIAWDTGWTTKITRTGETYVKTAYDAKAAAPVNTSEAERVTEQEH
jgi:hypothetical protein